MEQRQGQIEEPLQCKSFNLLRRVMQRSYEYINSNIEIVDLFHKLGFDLHRSGFGERVVVDGGDKTRGWKLSESLNIAKDFSGKGRLEGKPYNVLKQYFDGDREAMKTRLQDNYNLYRQTKRHGYYRKIRLAARV